VTDPRAGKPAELADLIDVPAVVAAYYTLHPDPSVRGQRVAFGTSGHRGSSLDSAFNEDHIAATCQAVVEYRRGQGIDGPLFLGRDTHALSMPAQITAIEVFAANDVPVLIDSRDGYTPTPALSRAIVRYNASGPAGRADGVVITPSHNPPRDGGIKYNPPHGGPAGSDVTGWIQGRANELLESGPAGLARIGYASALSGDLVGRHDYLGHYVGGLPLAIDLDAIRGAGLRVGVDPLGGAAVAYWPEIADRHKLSLEVLNEVVDPTWRFMTLDWDGKIRMDPSSANAMASLVAKRGAYDLATGNDADADRHGIVTADGLMNPNHYLAVAIDHLYRHRPDWPGDAAVGKTVVSSSIIDRVVADLGRRLVEVPVGFKWFVPGLSDGSIAFGGEESAGASFLCKDGSVWCTEKDGILLDLLAVEIMSVTGKSPSTLYAGLVERFGAYVFARVDAPASAEQKAVLSKLSNEQITATELAGEPIVDVYTRAPGNGEPIGGVKVVAESGWFAARPSGTEDLYKIYAESRLGPDHLAQLQRDAREVVNAALGLGPGARS
jgi:phosphoglucomutase